MAIVAQIMGIVDTIAPAYLKFEADKIGLQVGSPNAAVNRVLVTLELTGEVIAEAQDKGAQLILSHHPLIFQSLDRVLADDYVGGLVTGLIKSDISLLAAHTNLDRTRDGVSDVLARALDLQDVEALLPARDIQMFKLVVFVPKENVDEMVSALGNAGGGVIGDYSHCTFRTEGTGTFYPMLGAHPYLGAVGELNRVDEYRLEILVSPDKIERAIHTMLEVHPYEEVAYDIYEVKNPPAGVGFGRVGNMAKPLKLRNCVERWSDVLDADLRVSGDWNMVINRVAVCGGSGGELIGVAKASGADVFVTGDIKYHAAHAAHAIGLAIVDAGHAETERLVVPELAKELQRRIFESGLDVDVAVSELNTNPWNRG
ncbi:MAG TPA: Nif3-like dinuclear metal center hexameric protein [Anaerolineae bacterium]|jgi:dinuclear metal center YbgI/SA1388 family protein|nr:Nif3-like dinuclear metal center hexameric protein [Anaerolineae bacterium]